MNTHVTPSERSGRHDDPGLPIVAGTGLTGSRLADLARGSDWGIRVLCRSATGQAPREDIEADVTHREHARQASAERSLPLTALEGARTVICLLDAPIAPHPWIPAHRREPAVSCLSATVLITWIAASLPSAGRPEVLLSGSTTGFYGDRSDGTLVEASGPDEGFPPELYRRWESVVGPAAQAGLRVAQSRMGLVVSFSGGLGRILGAAYRVEAEARLGRGDQWQLWTALKDVAVGFLRAIKHSDVHGPVNLTAPKPARNRGLHRLLSRTGGLPLVVVVPQLLLDQANRAGAAGGTGSIGGMLAEFLGAPQCAASQALLTSDFRFTASDAVLVWTLGV